MSRSVGLDGRVDLADEEVGRVEADGARQNPEGQHDQKAVPEVQQCRYQFRYLQLEQIEILRLLCGFH